MLSWFGKWVAKHVMRQLEEFDKRLSDIELELAGDRMEILETADLVSYRLSQRERKRTRTAEPAVDEQDPRSRFLGAAARFGKGG